MMPAFAAGIAEAHQSDEQQGREADQQRNPGIAFEHGDACSNQRQKKHNDQHKAPLGGFAAGRGRVGVGNRKSHCLRVKKCRPQPQELFL